MPYSSRKERKRKKKRRQSWWKFFLVLFLLFIIAIAGTGVWAYSQYQSRLEPAQPSSLEKVELEIPFNSSMAEIGAILEENGIIQDGRVFNLYTRLNDELGIQAGFYQLSPGDNLEAIVQQLQEGGSDRAQEDVKSFTIPEGYNVMQVADAIEAASSFSAQEVLDLLDNEDFQNKMLEAYPDLLTEAMKAKDKTLYTFEGYLYPATYEIYSDMTLEEILMAMIDKSHTEFSPYYDQIAESDYNIHETLTLASFVEAEANNDEDRKLIAGVFLNRLAIDMPLQTDVSVGYARGEHLEYTTLEDANIDSPYNLYRHLGLGPGPNNNPSINSVDAVLNPTESNYLYFLADIDTQETYFSETFDEHLEKQAIYVDGTQEVPAESESQQ